MGIVNLRERFGRRYRVEYEESYYAERGKGARADDPALQIIPCRHGHIFPWDASTLAAYRSRGPIARKLAALPFATIQADGDDGVTILFPVGRFADVAALMKPRRRRQVSDAERERLRALGAKYGFRRGVCERQTSAVCEGRDQADTLAVCPAPPSYRQLPLIGAGNNPSNTGVETVAKAP